LNPGRRGGKPATNRLSYGAATRKHFIVMEMYIALQDIRVGNLYNSQVLFYRLRFLRLHSGEKNLLTFVEKKKSRGMAQEQRN
jgi:hypothetical protein